jgi:hypothetical protein
MGWLARLGERVAHADPVAIGLLAGGLIAAAGVSLALAWRQLHRARLIADTPTARARSAPQGYVELAGRARPFGESPLVAKLTGLPCCWYRYRIEEQVESHDQNNRGRSRWRTVDQGESDDTFWLEDDTGRVAIDPSGADVETRYLDTWESRRLTGINYTSFVREFLTSHPGSTIYRFREWRINRNDPIYVLGLLKNLGSHANAPSIEERVRDILSGWKRDQAELHQRFDLDRNGRIDEREWRLARSAARRAAQAQHHSESAAIVEGVNLMTATGDRNRPFIISAYPQEHVLRRYYWRALGYGLAFFAAGSVATWVVATRFG